MLSCNADVRQVSARAGSVLGARDIAIASVQSAAKEQPAKQGVQQESAGKWVAGAEMYKIWGEGTQIWEAYRVEISGNGGMGRSGILQTQVLRALCDVAHVRVCTQRALCPDALDFS